MAAVHSSFCRKAEKEFHSHRLYLTEYGTQGGPLFSLVQAKAASQAQLPYDAPRPKAPLASKATAPRRAQQQRIGEEDTHCKGAVTGPGRTGLHLITVLPTNSTVNDANFTVVDRLAKMLNLIPTQTTVMA